MRSMRPVKRFAVLPIWLVWRCAMAKRTITHSDLIACFRAAAGSSKADWSPHRFLANLVGALERDHEDVASALYDAAGLAQPDGAKPEGVKSTAPEASMYRIDESDLLDLAAKFEQASTLFDAIEDEVEPETRAYHLATIGLFLTSGAARGIKKMMLADDPRAGSDVEVCHD
ncbi:hypothetical protein HMPREF3115_23585 [Burkholderia sp. HMSC10F09]|nr:hypothetical protein HMPREF3115_23585 [Burkholderia sp. HMSC10F09]